jgi:hypothetical protein
VRYPATLCPLLLPFLLLASRELTAQTDSAPAIIAHFVVTAEGGVDTTTVRVEHTNDEAWIEQLRRGLASAKYKPAWRRGCPVARWSTFAVWAQH